MKFSELSQSKKLILMTIATLIVIAVFIAGFGFVSTSIGNWSADRKIEKSQKSANSAIADSQNATANAANYSIERQTEDGIREQSITPRVAEAKRNSGFSREEVQEAKKKYEKHSTTNLNSDAADNCRQLHELFPDTAFADCRQK